MWGYFQRALSVTSNYDAFCSDGLRAVLVNSDFTEFGRQRNLIHYRANVWKFDDLHHCNLRIGFGVPTDQPLDFAQDDFSLRLAFGLVRMAHTMLGDIATNSPRLKSEYDLAQQWLQYPFNELYQQHLLAVRDDG